MDIVTFTVLFPAIIFPTLILGLDGGRLITLRFAEAYRVESAASAGARQLYPPGGPGIYGAAMSAAVQTCRANSPGDSTDQGCTVVILAELPDVKADGDATAKFVSVQAASSLQLAIGIGGPITVTRSAVN